MVKAILAGRKTQTRRVMQLQPSSSAAPMLVRTKRGLVAAWSGESEFDGFDCHCPYGKKGDRLWVRETVLWLPENANFYYAADRQGLGEKFFASRKKIKSIPSIFMPRSACRIVLEITRICAERLQDITEKDARAEGARKMFLPGISRGDDDESFVDGFECLWNSINEKRGFGWVKNPWVWCITFKKVEVKT